MNLFPNKYYHLYNRSNNQEIVFRERENYLFFLKKYRKYLFDLIKTHCYCLMPNHFHFLIYINSNETSQIKNNIGILLSSYTKAINKKFSRTGSLFQSHTKTKLIEDEHQLLSIINYIHQNPLRKNLVNKLEDWEFSSYVDYAGKRNGTLIDKSLIEREFNSVEDFIFFSSEKVEKFDFIYK